MAYTKMVVLSDLSEEKYKFLMRLESDRENPMDEIMNWLLNRLTGVFVYAIFKTIWSVYSFICVNSLYLKIKEEQLPMSSQKLTNGELEAIPLKHVDTTQ